MTRTDIVMYSLLVLDVIAGVGGIVGVAIMFRRRTKERREKVEHRAHGQHA